jgi:hypothetical protein
VLDPDGDDVGLVGNYEISEKLERGRWNVKTFHIGARS